MPGTDYAVDLSQGTTPLGAGFLLAPCYVLTAHHCLNDMAPGDDRRHNIAHWTEATGHPGEALRLFRELLHDRTAALGPDHPHTLLNRYRVTRLMRPSVGGDGLTRLLPVFLRVFGEEHPWTRRLRHEIEAP
ncbi:tetratricopeptide repeat protein [Streptomyces sp. 4N124]|uniref:tetratricopeptide repeat protein n=1 Tax=Streptomyces sp. 4N124 TaxID=3457420 RepID=UPI003FD5D6B8